MYACFGCIYVMYVGYECTLCMSVLLCTHVRYVCMRARHDMYVCSLCVYAFVYVMHLCVYAPMFVMYVICIRKCVVFVCVYACLIRLCM